MRPGARRRVSARHVRASGFMTGPAEEICTCELSDDLAAPAGLAGARDRVMPTRARRRTCDSPGGWTTSHPISSRRSSRRSRRSARAGWTSSAWASAIPICPPRPTSSRRCSARWPTRPTIATRATGAIRSSPRPPPPSTSAVSAWTSTPTQEFMALLGAKEGLAHVCFADARRRRPGARPRSGLSRLRRRLHPGRRRGPLSAARAREGLPARPGQFSEEDAERAKVLFIGYPNNPTAAVIEGRLLRAGRGFRQALRHRRSTRQRLLGTNLRRLRGAQLPGHPGGQRRGSGVLQLLQALQYDRLAHRLRRGQPRDPGAPVAPQDQHGLRACSTPSRRLRPSS